MERKKRIFIADDEKATLELLTRLLTMSGFEVDSTQDPRMAVSIIKAFKPNLIMLDLLMPHIGGLQLCEILNKDKETSGIPIIIVSALSDYADIRNAYKLGVTGYVTKPFDFQELLKEIGRNITSKEPE